MRFRGVSLLCLELYRRLLFHFMPQASRADELTFSESLELTQCREDLRVIARAEPFRRTIGNERIEHIHSLSQT